ncbi:MAG: dipeptidase [Thermoprotei archaeon]
MSQSGCMAVHQGSYIVDSHVDSILRVVDQESPSTTLYQKSSEGHFDFPRMMEAHVCLPFMAAYTSHEYKPERAAHRALVLIEGILRQVEAFAPGLKQILAREDLELCHSRSQPGFLISLEGGEPYQGDIRLVRAFHRLGVRCVGLTYNERNQIGDGQLESRTKSGLTEFGVQVVEELNSLGSLIDVSHMSESTFYDVVNVTKKPIIATHSNCYALQPHGRNLKDDQLRAVRDSGGVVGITFVPKFLTEGKATVNHVVQHISHAAEVMGVNHVGIGSDFDGTSELPEGLSDVTRLPALTDALLRHGFSEKEVKRILGENYVSTMLNVFR